MDFSTDQELPLIGELGAEFIDQAIFFYARVGFRFDEIPAQDDGGFSTVDVLTTGTAAASEFKADFLQELILHELYLRALRRDHSTVFAIQFLHSQLRL